MTASFLSQQFPLLMISLTPFFLALVSQKSAAGRFNMFITSASQFHLSGVMADKWKKILTNPPDLCSRLQSGPLSSAGYDNMELPSPIPGEAGSNTSWLSARFPLYPRKSQSLLERLDENTSSLVVLQIQAWCFLPGSRALVLMCWSCAFCAGFILPRCAGFPHKGNFVMLKRESSFRLPP